jgi:hypothetical protein
MAFNVERELLLAMAYLTADHPGGGQGGISPLRPGTSQVDMRQPLAFAKDVGSGSAQRAGK